MSINMKYQLVHQDATPPTKAFETEVGYDISIVEPVKKISDTFTLYSTGVKVVLDQPGYYISVYPRSSLIKSGYMLANSVGIIDNTYRGEIMIALTKIDKDALPLQLPYKGFQLVICKQYDAYNVVQVDNISNDSTQRGTGGFGSTG